MRALTFIPLAALAACSASNGAPRDSGPVITRAFAAGGAFDAVELAGPDNVRVIAGATPSVSATGPSNLLDRLDIRVEGSTLKVGRKREHWGGNFHWDWSDRHDRGVTVTVTAPPLRAASVAGSGDMVVDQAAGDAFRGEVAGSGSLTLGAVKAGTARLDIAGSGNLIAVGSARDVRASIAGSGNIDAGRLTGETADVDIMGSGDARVHATGHASVDIMGSGNVTVSGTSDCKVSKMGSGDVRCMP